jgi:prolyl-tRNA synthetase
MAHGDDHGLRLPPNLAPVQTVIVPIFRSDDDRARVMEKAEEIGDRLADAGVRVELDDTEGASPGFKFNHWEVRGVPLRLELGPRDLEEGHVMASPRNRPGREGKFTIPMEGLADRVVKRLEAIQAEMLADATEYRDSRTYEIDSYDQLVEQLPQKPGFYRVWWDGGDEEEQRMKEETKATVRCIPLGEPEGSGKCFMTGRETDRRAVVARAY